MAGTALPPLDAACEQLLVHAAPGPAAAAAAAAGPLQPRLAAGASRRWQCLCQLQAQQCGEQCSFAASSRIEPASGVSGLEHNRHSMRRHA